MMADHRSSPRIGPRRLDGRRPVSPSRPPRAREGRRRPTANSGATTLQRIGPRELPVLPLRRDDPCPAVDAQAVEDRGREDGRLGFAAAQEQQQPLIDFLSAEYPADAPPARLDRLTSARPRRTIRARPVGGSRSSGDAVRGGRLTLKNCANCHGPDGQGAELGPNLVEKPVLWRKADYREVVREGRGRMPGFATALDDSAEQRHPRLAPFAPIPSGDRRQEVSRRGHADDGTRDGVTARGPAGRRRGCRRRRRGRRPRSGSCRPGRRAPGRGPRRGPGRGRARRGPRSRRRR